MRAIDKHLVSAVIYISGEPLNCSVSVEYKKRNALAGSRQDCTRHGCPVIAFKSRTFPYFTISVIVYTSYCAMLSHDIGLLYVYFFCHGFTATVYLHTLWYCLAIRARVKTQKII